VILVTGASGFVGRAVVRELSGAALRVRALVRSPRSARALEGLECELVTGDVTDPSTLPEALDGCASVVHLVAVINGRAGRFEQVIAEGTANVVDAARRAGIGRLVHMSALGVSAATKDTVPYYRAKWQAEQIVAASGLGHVMLRPSFVFGPSGGALPLFVRIARLAPVTPVVGPGTQRLQPLWVGDLARGVRLALDTGGGIVELGGPDVVDWNELWRRIKEAIGTRRPAIHVPSWLLRPQAALLELLPRPPLTRDQLTMLSLGDNVVSDGGAAQAALGLGGVLDLDEQLRRTVAAEAG
jgi:NADH dehydrogenase